MTLKKLTAAGCVIASLGLGTGTGALVIRGVRAQNAAAPAGAAPAQPVAKAAPATPAGGSTLQQLTQYTPPSPGIDPQLQRVIAAAAQRLDVQRAYYEEGRITIDRFMAASENLERVELLAAKNPAERGAVRQRNVDRLAEVLKREQEELLIGRGTVADVAEAQEALEQARYRMKVGDSEDAEKALLLRRIDDLERMVQQLQKERGRQERR